MIQDIEIRRRRSVNTASGSVMMLLAGLLYAWSIFRAPLSAMFPDWSVSEMSLTFTISMSFFCIGTFFAGKLSMRLKNRSIMLIAAALLIVGFVGLSRTLNVADPAASLYFLYVFYGILCGGGVGMVYNTMLNSLTKWFPGKTGMISGILLFCYGLGGIILGGVVNFLVSRTGLPGTFMVLGVGIGVLVIAGAFTVRLPREKEAAVVARPAPAKLSPAQTNSEADARQYTTGEMVKTSVFWLFFIWNILVVIAGLMVMNGAAVIAVDFGAPALLGLIATVFSGVGRLAIGVLFDRKGRHAAMLTDSLIMTAAGVLLILGALGGGTPCIVAGLSLTGLGFGGAPSSTQAIVNNYFGSENYAVNMSMVTFSVIPAAIIGPLVSSALQEASGNYVSTFIMFLAVAVLTVITNGILRSRALKGGYESMPLTGVKNTIGIK